MDTEALARKLRGIYYHGDGMMAVAKHVQLAELKARKEVINKMKTSLAEKEMGVSTCCEDYLSMKFEQQIKEIESEPH